MKKLLWNQIRYRLIMYMTAVLLALGIAIVFGGAAPVQAADIPISSVEDLMKMESNPSGSYYLTKDITLPENMQPLFTKKKFKGTLDGNGHKLKNYTFQSTDPVDDYALKTSLFDNARNATFKNLSLTDVNININIYGKCGVKAHPLVGYAWKCKFDNIKVSGNITVKRRNNDEDQVGGDLFVSGLIGNGYFCKITNCSSSLKINVSGEYITDLLVGGIVSNLLEGTVKNCSFSGNISVSAKPSGSSGVITGGFTAGGICGDSGLAKISGCTNSGNITVKGFYDGTGTPVFTNGVGAYGIGGDRATGMSSCKNTGNIKADNNSNAAFAAGLVKHVSDNVPLTKCRNEGNVSAAGKAAHAGGLCMDAGFVNQCYNKGEVSASGSKINSVKEYRMGYSSSAGGLCGWRAVRMQNCYNAGNVTLSGSGYAGGLAESVDIFHGDSTANYVTGTVLAKNGGKYLGSYAAMLFPKLQEEVEASPSKCSVYDNYYKTSTGCKAYGSYTKHTWTPQATKVSLITSKNCPKLSSKYWTYSSKYKRMVLKNNKEK